MGKDGCVAGAMAHSSPALPTLRLRVNPAAETAVRSGHPWLFGDSVRAQNRDGQAGELAVIFDRKDEFLAVGLFDPQSPIRVRVLHTGRPVKIDAAWWRERLRAAVARRQGLFDDATTGFRWINGESDGWPALVLDRYGATCVLKIYSEAWLGRLNEVASLIKEELAPEQLIVRTSRNVREAAERAGIEDGAAWTLERVPSPARPPPVVFLESGLRFEADVARGQKTGFFLDQRENRRRVEALAADAAVLNVFSFTGGFSLYAARGGARTVTDVDISPHALEAGKRNHALNTSLPAVAACAREAVQAEAFAWLEGNGARKFDLVILDPPSLARREGERAGAIAAYARLAARGVAVLRKGGVLVAASCSAHVTEEEFFGAVRQACARSGRSFAELATTGHPPDHPATFAEARYLKCIYLRG